MVVVDGYLQPHPGAPPSGCPRFSVRLTPAVAPWAFAKKGEAYRAIAALELLASLLCLVLLGGRLPERGPGIAG
jgi:hypothetical protein